MTRALQPRRSLLEPGCSSEDARCALTGLCDFFLSTAERGRRHRPDPVTGERTLHPLPGAQLQSSARLLRTSGRVMALQVERGI